MVAGGESFGDWNSKLVDIKKAFAHLKASLMEERGEGVCACVWPACVV